MFVSYGYAKCDYFVSEGFDYKCGNNDECCKCGGSTNTVCCNSIPYPYDSDSYNDHWSYVGNHTGFNKSYCGLGNSTEYYEKYGFSDDGLCKSISGRYDEYGIVGRIKLDNQNRFFPVAISCQNSDKSSQSWFGFTYVNGYYHYIDEFSSGMTDSSYRAYKDKKYTLNEIDKYNYRYELNIKSFESKDRCKSGSSGFDSMNLEGVTEYLEHGFISENIRVFCGYTRVNNKNISYVTGIRALGTNKKIHCTKGYKAEGWNCKPICNPGQYYNGGCVGCESGSYCPDGFNKVKCLDGQTTEEEGATSEDQCFSRCDKGQYLPRGETKCESCPEGYECYGGNLHSDSFRYQGVYLCPDGSYLDKEEAEKNPGIAIYSLNSPQSKVCMPCSDLYKDENGINMVRGEFKSIIFRVESKGISKLKAGKANNSSTNLDTAKQSCYIDSGSKIKDEYGTEFELDGQCVYNKGTEDVPKDSSCYGVNCRTCRWDDHSCYYCCYENPY